jgi:integrase/recombinase XerC
VDIMNAQPPNEPSGQEGALVPVPAPIAGDLVPASPAKQLLRAFLSGRSAETLRAYRQDLAGLAAFLEADSPAVAGQLLLAGGHGQANAAVLADRAHVLERKLSPSKVNRRLAAVRSVFALARTLGLVAWSVDVPGVRTEAYRDTAGPGRKGFRKMLDAAAARQDAKGLRDLAVLRLLHDLGLRRAEVCRLDVEDFDLQAGTLAVLGKGKREKARLTLPEPTAEALRAWLAARPDRRRSAPTVAAGEPGQDPGQAALALPLFVSLDRARKGSGRLTGKGVSRPYKAREGGRAEGLAPQSAAPGHHRRVRRDRRGRSEGPKVLAARGCEDAAAVRRQPPGRCRRCRAAGGGPGAVTAPGCVRKWALPATIPAGAKGCRPA